MKTQEPLVSVIMPAYNVEAYIAESILSIVDQDYRNLELVVVNDGSTDGTLRAVRQLAERYPNTIRHFTICNSGPAMARNAGIARAKGEIIAYQDSDDVSMSRRISREVSYLLQHPNIAMVYGGIEVRQVDGRIQHHAVQPFDCSLLLLRNYIACGTVMHWRQVFDKAGLWNENDDWDLWIRISEHFAIGNLSEVVYQYREHFSEFRYSLNVPRNALMSLKTFVQRYRRKREAFVGIKVALLFVQYHLFRCLQMFIGDLGRRPGMMRMIFRLFQFSEYKAFHLLGRNPLW